MTDEERAALVEQAAEAAWQAESQRAAGRPRLIKWEDAGPGEHHRFRSYAAAALAAIEPAIRADERARAVEEATTDEAVGGALATYSCIPGWRTETGPAALHRRAAMRAAIRAALGVER